MANKALQNLDAAGTLAATDIFPIKQSAARLKKATLSAMRNYLQGGHRTTVAVTGTSKTLDITDAGTHQECTNASAQTITVPPDVFEAGTEIEFLQLGAGQVGFALGAGVTIQPSTTLKISAQYKMVLLKQTSTLNTWVLIGSLSA